MAYRITSLTLFVVLAIVPIGVLGSNETSGINTSIPGVYNTSKTPSSLPWNTYNYCNAPHVNAAHYTTPTNVSGSKLVYMNVMMRHHKVRTS